MYEDLIQRNSMIHDKLVDRYDLIHSEIFNEIEQRRLDNAVRASTQMMVPLAGPLKAFDFGCGTGNLTKVLVDLGAEVVSGDVSVRSLEFVRRKFNVEVRKLNGQDFKGIQDASFDFVGCYSVLHHVPDYLRAVSEMGRICRLGGVVYIDHEPPEEYWFDCERYAEFRCKVRTFSIRKFMYLSNYTNKLKRLFNPRHTNEGDIHVWPDDHVDWNAINDILVREGFVNVLDEKFLLFRREYRMSVYESYMNELSDMRTMAFKKVRSPI